MASRGAVRDYTCAASTSAIDVDFEVPGSPDFELLSVTVNYNAAPTTSENLVIKSVIGSVTSTEKTIDPTQYGYTSYVFDFNKSFQKGTVIGVDYTNTDGKSITVQIKYQEV
jgi:hypothetical protein